MKHRRSRAVIHGLLAVALLMVAGLVSPVAAHADGWRTATASDWGPNMSAGSTNAQNAARRALRDQARPAAEVCTNVTSSATWVWTAPDGSAYVFNGTATGFCAQTPPYVVYRAATQQGGASTSAAARDVASQAAMASVRAVGGNCIEMLVSLRLLFSSSSWWAYEATASGLCTN